MGAVLFASDVPSLTNATQLPFVVVLNCSNGYFTSPNTQHGLAEALVLAPNGGAAGCFSSVGLGFLTQVTPLSSYLYDHAFLGESSGSATTGAKVDAYLLAGALEDNLWEYLLFGDPAASVLAIAPRSSGAAIRRRRSPPKNSRVRRAPFFVWMNLCPGFLVPTRRPR